MQIVVVIGSPVYEDASLTIAMEAYPGKTDCKRYTVSQSRSISPRSISSEAASEYGASSTLRAIRPISHSVQWECKCVTLLAMPVTNFDSLLVRAYHENVLPSLVSVQCTNTATGATLNGTATVIAHSGSAEAGFIPYLATAGHLLPDENVETRFRLTRYSFEDLANPAARIAEFVLPQSECGTLSPAYMRLADKEGLSRIDAGIIRAPVNCTDGKPWFASSTPQAESMQIERANNWSAEGSEVAWAGFPGIVMDIARRPQPCFYRGVVSSLLIRDEFQLYMLDGHNTYGISGGPVWAIDAESQHPKLIAVIGGYRYHNDCHAMPGLVFATPIQVLLSAVSNDYSAKSIAMA